jgi:hypothetical protein
LRQQAEGTFRHLTDQAGRSWNPIVHGRGHRSDLEHWWQHARPRQRLRMATDPTPASSASAPTPRTVEPDLTA